MAGLGGVIFASRLSSVDLNAGSGTILLDAIAAAVIGGTSLFGGRGEIKSALLGAPDHRVDRERDEPARLQLGDAVHRHRCDPARRGHARHDLAQAPRRVGPVTSRDSGGAALGVALLGYAFMGKAHSRALVALRRARPAARAAARLDLGSRPRRRCRGGRALRLGGGRHGLARAGRRRPRRAVRQRRPERAARRADDRGRAARASTSSARSRSPSTPRSRTRCGAPPRTPGVVHACGFNYRFVPAVRRARELVEAGAIGELVHFRARYLQSWGWDAPTRRLALRPCARRARARSATSARTSSTSRRYLAGEIAAVAAVGAHVRPRPRGRRRVRRDDRARGRRHRDARGVAPRARPRQPEHLRAQRLGRLDRLRPRALRRAARSPTAGRSASSASPATGGLRATRSAGATRSRSSTRTSSRAIAGEATVAPHGATFEDGYRAAEVCDAILRSAGERDRERGSSTDEDEPRHLGARADGHALRARRLPAAVGTASRAPRRCAARSSGLGDLMDGYEFHYPDELSPRQPRRGARARSAGTTSTASPAACTSTRASASGGLTLARRRGARRGARASRSRRPTSPARSARTSSSGPGIEGYNYPFQTPYAESGRASSTASARPRERRARARRDDLPRAQELRAGDEDP